MSHLTLIHGGDVGDDDEDSENEATWLASTLHPQRPFDQFVDAIELFQQVHGVDPETLYLHPDTYFWLSLHYSNFNLEDEPEPEPFWVEVDRFTSVVDIVVKHSPLVPKGWWHLVRSVSADVDLSCWR